MASFPRRAWSGLGAAGAGCQHAAGAYLRLFLILPSGRVTMPTLSCPMIDYWITRTASDPTAGVSVLYSRCSLLGFLPLWLSGKESACSAGAPEEAGLIPGWGSSPGEGNGNPLQYSCLGNPVDRGAWPATVPGVRESRTLLKRLSEQARHSKYIVSIHLHNYKALCPQVTDKETEAQKSQVP